jgi:hypothetical protein
MGTEIGSEPVMGAAAGLEANHDAHLDLVLKQHWNVKCHDKDGKLLWEEDIDNLVTTVGKNKYLDSTLKTGVTSPTWFVGLVDNASFSAYSAADTMSSHAGWIEGVPYSNGTRGAWTPGTIASGSVDNSASAAVFNCNATLTVRGAFLVDNSTKSGTTGTLLGEVDFSAAQPVVNTNTLTVTVTCSLT